MVLALYSVVGFLGLFFLLFILFLIIVLSLWFRSSKALRAQLRNVTNLSFKQSHINSCYCCASGSASSVQGADNDISENGFTMKLAENYVESIAESIEFGKGDTQIRKALAKKQISCGPVIEEREAASKDPGSPVALAIEGTVPTPDGNGSAASGPPVGSSDSML